MRLVALLVTLNCLAAFVPQAAAQSAPEQVSNQCENRATIERAVDDLRRLLVEKRREKEITGASKLDEEIKTLEGQIVETVYKLECFYEHENFRADTQFVEITNYYATNRKTTGFSRPSLFFGSDDSGKLAYGKTTVSVPSRHQLGALELPTLWKLELSPDPAKHFLLKSVEPIEKDAALAGLTKVLAESKSKSLLLFIHGFNVSFEDAALRTAQLANDLQFPGPVMFFSWPSDGAPRGYSHDEESVQLARPAFDTLLDDLSAQPFQEIYILGHSMGARLVADILAERQKRGATPSNLKEVALAAADINNKIFERDLAPVLAQMRDVKRTIYASSNDLALRASKSIHEFRRVGETTEGVSVYQGFETIDATGVSSFRNEWGHSYIFDSPLVIADYSDAVIRHVAIGSRNLKSTGKAPNAYWLLQ
jgi:esterase/lipase superfamily enzyme